MRGHRRDCVHAPFAVPHFGSGPLQSSEINAECGQRARQGGVTSPLGVGSLTGQAWEAPHSGPPLWVLLWGRGHTPTEDQASVTASGAYLSAPFGKSLLLLHPDLLVTTAVWLEVSRTACRLCVVPRPDLTHSLLSLVSHLNC